MSRYKKANTFSPSLPGFMSLRMLVERLAEDMLQNNIRESSKKANQKKNPKLRPLRIIKEVVKQRGNGLLVSLRTAERAG